MVTYDGRPSPFTQLTSTSDWESLFSSAGIADGIDNVNSAGLAPSLDTPGRNAVMTAGQCVIKGALWRADASVSTPIPAASAQNRYDRLVIQLSRAAATSPAYVQPVIVQVTPGASPAVPPLIQTPTGIFQIPVSHWLSQSTGALSALVDERDFVFDVWHNFPAPLPSGFANSGSCRYKMVQSRYVFLHFAVTVSTGAASGGPALYQMPVAYSPTVAQRMSGMGYYANGQITPSIASMRGSVNTDGTLQLLGFPGGAVNTGITEIDYSGYYALD